MSVDLPRCGWCGDDALYMAYHDAEWGVPIRDRQRLFELLVLETMQAGLSWITVLRKRGHMRLRLFGFDMARLARADEATVADWMQDAGLIRNERKLRAMLGNARLTLERDDFVDWLWSFAPAENQVYRRETDVPAKTRESAAMSQALKAAGYRWVGPTVCYALMQSAGMVNDHIADCVRFLPCRELQQAGR